MKSPDNYKDVKLPIFFLDETGILNKTDDPFFALGVLKTEKPHELQRAIRTIRDKNHFYEEIKWTKMSPLKFGVSESIIQAFIKDKSAVFSSIILEKRNFDFNKYFKNDLNKVYKSFTVILLKNNINFESKEVCTVIADDYFYPEGVNLELASRAIINDHYKRLVVAGFLQINSKASDLIQLADLLLGATIYDLKLLRGSVKQCDNLKFRTLKSLHKKFDVKESFFLNSGKKQQSRFLTSKFKVSIFEPRGGKKEF